MPASMIPPLVMELHERGSSTIPLITKHHPAVKWKDFQTRLPSLLELLAWNEECNTGMWAVITGTNSGVMVLDFDGLDGLATLAKLGLEPHVTSPSGGYHVHVEHPGAGAHVVTRAPLDRDRWPGMDSRGDGGYAVVCGRDERDEYEWHGRDPLAWDALPAELRAALTQPSGRKSSLPEAIRPRVAEGERHEHLLSVAGGVAATGASAEAIEAAITAENQAVCEPPQDDTEIAGQAADVIARYAGHRRFELTDLGNAERLADLHAGDLRYVPGIGWLVWDRQRWRPDDDGSVVRMAGAAARSRYLELVDKPKDDKAREALIKWIRQSESERLIRAAMKLAESQTGIVTRAVDLNTDPWLLNVENGTIDLRTAQLREHRREDLITKLAPVSYQPGARSERWDAFLRQTAGDHDVMTFLQRAVGCTLVGYGSESIFFIHGPGATGKTTFVEAIKQMLGGYALTSAFESFLRKRPGSIPADIARFPGARLVVASEVDEGQSLAEGLIKQLTGGDTVTARHLYGSPFEFKPCLTLWFIANSRPRVRGDDDGFWRRMVQVPFENVIPEEDRDDGFKRELTQDPEIRAAILSWAVEGCIQRQRDGLGVPQRVRDYTSEYRTENSPIERWMADELQLEPMAIATVGELQQSLSGWSRQSGLREIAWTDVTKALRKAGCETTKINGIRGWKYVKVKFEPDLDGQDGQDGNVVKSLYARACGEVTQLPSTPSTPSTAVKALPRPSPSPGRKSGSESPPRAEKTRDFSRAFRTFEQHAATAPDHDVDAA